MPSSTAYDDSQARLTKTIVWEDRAFSSGWYICRIERNEDKTAILSISLEGQVNHLIHQEPITLGVDSSGGPVQDVVRWKTMCDDIIDHPKLRSSVAGLSEWFLQ